MHIHDPHSCVRLNTIDHAQVPLFIDLQQCINGFTEPTPHNASERGHENFTTLRLIPGMNFSCNGEIVWLTIAGQLRSDEQYTQCPKLYIWRKLSAQWYIRTDSDHEVALSSNVCSMETWANVSDSRDVYECSLEENAYVSFQCGDFIGLELPPRKNATFLLYFTEDGPTNAIYFQGNSRPFAMENTQPQITLGIRSKFLSIKFLCVHACILVTLCVYVPQSSRLPAAIQDECTKNSI